MSELCCFTTGLSARRRAKRAHAQSRARLQETGARLEDKELLMIFLSSEGRRGAHLLLCYQFTDLPNKSDVATCSYSFPFIPLLPLFHLCIKHNGLRFLYLHNVGTSLQMYCIHLKQRPPLKRYVELCLNAVLLVCLSECEGTDCNLPLFLLTTGSGGWSLGAGGAQLHLVSAESHSNNNSKKMQINAKKIHLKIYFEIMFNHLIRLYIAVLVCVLLISVYSVPIEPF